MSSFRVSEVRPEEMEDLCRTYPYVLLYQMSSKYLGRTEGVDVSDRREWLEARFFSGEGELHFYLGEDGREKCLEIRDAGEDPDSICRSYKTEGQTISQITVRQYIEYDTDGQAYVGLTRLCGAKEGK